MAYSSTDVLDKANAIRDAFTKDATRIGNRTDLTATARQQRLMTSYQAAKAQMLALQQTATADTTARRLELRRKLFGVSDLPGDAATNAISSRDALDRVNSLTDPADALKVLDRANNNGDEVLARAIAAHAFDMWQDAPIVVSDSWLSVLQAYCNGRPDSLGNNVQELLDLSDRKLRPTDLWRFSLTPPMELVGVINAGL